MVKDFYQDTSKKLLIIGCGGHSKVVTDVAKEVGFRNILYKDINLSKKEFLGEKVLQDDIKNYTDYFFVAIGDNFVREKVYMNFHQKNKNSIAATLIHPSSVISKNCSIGNGTIVMPLCVINSSSEIGQGIIINTRSSVDHDNYLMDFCSIGPGVTTGGSVKIGKRSSIGLGTIIKNDINIGSDNVIGAASYINKSINNNLIVFGTPAKIKRERRADEKYL